METNTQPCFYYFSNASWACSLPNYFSYSQNAWVYHAMTFGLTNALAVFQRMVNDILWDIIFRFVFVHLDDILIFSTNLEEHIQHIRQVM